MKTRIPYPVTRARIEYSERDLLPIRLRHITAALLVLPAIGGGAYIVARIIFSLPTP